MNLDDLAAVLDRYPLSSACFSSYLQWLSKRPDADLEENDLITALSQQDHERLERLESLLIRSQEILGLSDTEFRNGFGFSHDLLAVDPEKVHDILAEPILVVNLSDHGFDKIEKLPRFIKHNAKRIPVADFVACRFGKKYAIELKTIRMENNPKPVPGKPMGNATKPYWWGEMFKNNLITKIEDKDRKAITQLLNTKRHMSCDYAMLALYTRRLGPSTLMDSAGYEKELEDIKSKYPEIDYIFFKDYFGQAIVCPQLDA